jgi:hypothetical protein
MTGQIIQFSKYGELPRAQAYRNQAVPRGLASVRRLHDTERLAHGGKNVGPAAGKPQGLERQIAHITDLLNELEDLARSADAPAAALRQARIGIERARAILQPLRASECKADVEGEAQPTLNHEELERMYRDLRPEA